MTTPEHLAEELKRIPLIQKTAAAADVMNIREIEEKIGQYCQLCELYAEASCKLTRKSKLSQEEAARACKVYEPYIQDILQQVDVAIANICDGEGTQRPQMQRTLPHTHHHTKQCKN